LKAWASRTGQTGNGAFPPFALRLPEGEAVIGRLPAEPRECAGGDPVAAGLVTNLPRPDGNLTGVSFVSTELMPKRLQLLSELAPQARVFALLVNPNSPNTELTMRNVPDIARAKGLQLHILKAIPEARSTTPSRPSRNFAPAHLSSALTPPSSANATGSRHWHCTTPFRRSTTHVNSPRPAG
jgi:hypothetical protein